MRFSTSLILIFYWNLKRIVRDIVILIKHMILIIFVTSPVPGGDVYSARRDVSEPETLATLERCFRLLANTRRSSVTNGRRGSVTNIPPPSSGTLLGRFLKRPVFDRLKHRVTRMDHNLFDVIWPSLRKYSSSNNSRAGSGISTSSNKSTNNLEDEFTATIVAPDYESYVVFAELFDPFIRDIHCVTSTGELPEHPLPCFFDALEATDENHNIEEAISIIQSYDLDPTCKYILAGVIDCCRNMEEFALPATLTINQLEETEKQITQELLAPDIADVMAEGSSEDEAGNYYTLNEVLDRPNEIRARLAAAGLLLPITETEISDERRLHGKHWPYGRGVYVAAAGDLAVWINLQDHIRIICSTSESKPGQIGQAYVRMARIMNTLDDKLTFKRDEKLGFLSARPSAIGNTMRINLIVRLPSLSKEPDNLRHLCIVRGLRVKDTLKSDTVKIGNQQCLSITELQTLQDFSRAVLNILSLEKELSLTNSMKIASLIANMFRKRSSHSRSSQM